MTIVVADSQYEACRHPPSPGFGAVPDLGPDLGAALTTSWGAPLRAYALAQNIATGDRQTQEMLWKGLGTQDRADVVIALGAQARLAARLARMADGAALPVPQGIWDRIICDHVREFAIEAWLGMRAVRIPRHPCGDCLRAAAEALAEFHLTALTAIGSPRALLAERCAMAVARAGQPVVARG